MIPRPPSADEEGVIDRLLSGLAWYRRMAGGTWYYVRASYDAQLRAWVRRPYSFSEIILDVESYHG